MNRVANKVAVVTGGAVGIGRACVERLAQEGASVAILDINDSAGQALAARLSGQGFAVAFWHADTANEAQVQQVITEVVQRFGKLNVLVNNAGIAGTIKPTHEITEAEWDRVQAVNVKGVFFCTKHAIPHLQRAGGGSIINLSSICGLLSTTGVPPYHASKGAVRLMTKNDAMLYAPDKIRVNSIHPGYIWTPMVENFLRQSSPDLEAAKQAAGALHPLGHMGEPDDIAWGVVFLASDESKFMTGSELVIDGGYTAR